MSSTQRPLVSIVTPSFNQGAFVERTLRSVLGQDYPHIEHIVIDGASTDETRAVLSRYSASDEPRLFWTSAPDRGQADAVNKGFARARGAILGWLNSDDTYAPGAIATIVRFFNDHPDVDLVYGEGWYIDEHDRVIGRYPTEPFDAARLLDVCFICQPAVFFRRALLDAIGVLDPSLRFCMDYDYWIRASTRSRVSYLQTHLANSRLHRASKTATMYVEAHREVLRALRAHTVTVPARWVSAYASARASRTLMRSLSGLHKDGWASPHVRLTPPPAAARLVIEGLCPERVLPMDFRIVRGGTTLDRRRISTRTFRVDVPCGAGPGGPAWRHDDIDIHADKSFTPQAVGLGSDSRALSYKMRRLAVVDATGAVQVLYNSRTSYVCLLMYAVLFVWTSLRVNRTVGGSELRRKVSSLCSTVRLEALG